MDLSKRVSEDVVKIFHNAKGSIFNDVLKWTHALQDHKEHALQVNDHLDSRGVFMAKEKRVDENPSIFSEQPVSEYAQQPFSPQDDLEPENHHPKNEEKNADPKVDEQLTEEERSTLEGLKRDEDIEQRRSEYGGFIGSQR